MDVKTVDANAVFRAGFTRCKDDTQTLILDVRNKKEYQKQHVGLAYNIRLTAKGDTLLVCRSHVLAQHPPPPPPPPGLVTSSPHPHLHGGSAAHSRLCMRLSFRGPSLDTAGLLEEHVRSGVVAGLLVRSSASWSSAANHPPAAHLFMCTQEDKFYARHQL